MQRVLIIGDSITEGITGINYIELLEENYPEIEFVNLGLGGDTLIGVSNRLIEYLKKDHQFDGLVIEAGHNDILIPHLEELNLPYKLTALSFLNRGSFPIEEPEVFYKQYETLIKYLKDNFSFKIFVTTLSCINESLAAWTNLKRHMYNEKVTKLANIYNIELIDVADLFDAYLTVNPSNDYLLENYFRAFLVDSKLIKTPDYLQDLSEERHLNLTIDGVHLNQKGAEIYKNAFSEALKKL